ncbi:hypothetical protein CPS_3334 [Colwellia psychrerythraea 34H]|uniref:Uncharacterized protein n=1 Tax=Colwellia psychrerythraea (strain 34H / ATCC BAA-681) TaxID=167879 RepID=Q47YV9_COLP3|nr:hypothetical protein CPS_3334 [Colwellia psychrerythraea 34H]
MPAPPAIFTALLLSTRAIAPRRHRTIFPATATGSKTPGMHSSLPASAESISANSAVPAVIEAPKNSHSPTEEAEP